MRRTADSLPNSLSDIRRERKCADFIIREGGLSDNSHRQKMQGDLSDLLAWLLFEKYRNDQPFISPAPLFQAWPIFSPMA